MLQAVQLMCRRESAFEQGPSECRCKAAYVKRTQKLQPEFEGGPALCKNEGLLCDHNAITCDSHQAPWLAEMLRSIREIEVDGSQALLYVTQSCMK